MSDDTDPKGELGSQRNEETRNKAAKVAQQQADESVRWLMADEKGRRFVRDQITRAGIYQTSMAGTPEMTAFNEGRRNMGLMLLADVVRLAPEQYPRMQAEAVARANPQKKDKDDNG